MKLKLIIFLFPLIWITSELKAVKFERPEVITAIKRKLNKDSVDYLSVLKDIKWSGFVRNKYANSRVIDDLSMDTIDVRKNDIISLHAHVRISPALLQKIYYIYYDIKGSALLRMNGKTILATGYFASRLSDPPDKRNIGYQAFFFNDTSANMSLVFFPALFDENFIESLRICEKTWVDKEVEKEQDIKLKDVFAGGIHLTFGIIFLVIFLFHKSDNENLYFAGYGLIIGTYFMMNSFGWSTFVETMLLFSWLPAMEIIAVFLCKVILNRERNKIILCIMLFLPFGIALFEYLNESADPISMGLGFGLGFIFLIAFEGIVILYYLIQGFFQKSWEAKTIAYGFLFSLAFYVALICFFIYITMTFDTRLMKIVKFAPMLGAFGILITISIILGRRNGETKSRLKTQLIRIEHLSKENLAKEIEKKHFLENQNIELERLVSERTFEIVKQKEVIQTKNNEITDNLTYAKKNSDSHSS